MERGMRVLDLECGAGDASLRIAKLVGPTGLVVGIYESAKVIDVAQRRAAVNGRCYWARFVAPDLNTFVPHERFDAVVARLTLFRQDERATFLRLSACVRPSGVIMVVLSKPAGNADSILHRIGSQLSPAAMSCKAFECLLPSIDLVETETMQRAIAMARRKNIALVAHDNKKEELVEWAKCNCKLLAEHSLYSTSATGQLLQDRLGLNMTLLESGPLGGDLQIGSHISEGQIDFVIFFSDPLQTQPHDPDVKALLRITVVWNVPVACNRASADFIISSPLMSTAYERLVPDYSKYRARPAVGTRSKPAAERPAEKNSRQRHNLGVHEMDWRKSRSIPGKPSNTRPKQILFVLGDDRPAEGIGHASDEQHRRPVCGGAMTTRRHVKKRSAVCRHDCDACYRHARGMAHLFD